MTPFEVRLFERLPFAADAVQLRRYDDRAKQPGKRTPPLRHFLDTLDVVMHGAPQPGFQRSRCRRSAITAASTVNEAATGADSPLGTLAPMPDAVR